MCLPIGDSSYVFVIVAIVERYIRRATSRKIHSFSMCVVIIEKLAPGAFQLIVLLVLTIIETASRLQQIRSLQLYKFDVANISNCVGILYQSNN